MCEQHQDNTHDPRWYRVFRDAMAWLLAGKGAAARESLEHCRGGRRHVHEAEIVIYRGCGCSGAGCAALAALSSQRPCRCRMSLIADSLHGRGMRSEDDASAGAGKTAP